MSPTNLAGLVVSAIVIVLLGVFGLKRVMNFRGWTLIIGGLGVTVGLLFGALLSVPLSNLPDPFGVYLPLVTTTVLVIAVVALMIAKITPLIHILSSFLPKRFQASRAAEGKEAVVDTSVLIDGRISDIALTGFLPGKLVIPRFVLNELQRIADSDDALKRQRGRRGLEVLNQLTQSLSRSTEIVESDYPDIKAVDAKLVRLARERGASVLTNDYNLNKVAKIEGVSVLNINDLANAVKAVMLPGELLNVEIVQKGKERSQGVGYMPDGTMIVVENAADQVGATVETEVTKILQTSAGKMVFAQLHKK